MLQFVVTGRESPAFGGHSFGAAGPYERLTGYAVGELDPAHPLNAGIVDLDRAPRNARGRVEYRVDICILKPVEIERGNGWIFYEVLNRGSKRALHRINSGTGANVPRLMADAGTGYLMNEGYTIVWSGWQGDVKPGDGRMLADLPVAWGVEGETREEFIDDSGSPRFTADLVSAAAGLDPAQARLTVRAQERDPRATPPGLAFRFLTERRIEIVRPEGYDAGAIFELIYSAKDPIVMGTAFAAVRDVNAFLRNRPADEDGRPNPLRQDGRNPIRRTLLFGLSQSGRFVRDFLYRGFNRAIEGGPVFDAAIPIIAGSRKTFINARFAQPGRYSRQHEDHLFPDDQFPFAYVKLDDPISGRSDGLLETCRASGTMPKLMHFDTDSEMWQARASLVATDCEGRDIVQPDDVRLYFASGLPHGTPGEIPPAVVEQAINPVGYGALLRPLITAMREWVDEGREPPPSRFPSVSEGTLVPPEAVDWPPIPDVTWSGSHTALRLLDHSTQPPREGAAYPVLLPKLDADGNALGGIRHPLIEATLATLTGWNHRSPGWGHPALCGIVGSIIPLPQTAEERIGRGDPRPAVEERYGDKDGYLAALTAVCERMVAERHLLQEDADRFIAAVRDGRDPFTAA